MISTRRALSGSAMLRPRPIAMISPICGSTSVRRRCTAKSRQMPLFCVLHYIPEDVKS